MREKFNKLIDRYGYKELFFIFSYPIFLPLFMIKDTTFSIYNIIKALLKYDWKYLVANDKQNAYNNLFYYIQDYNIQKFGRYGKSNLLAGGSFILKNLFHTTPFSLRMQASFGTTFIMFFAMCFWLLSWVILYQDNPNLWILLVVVFSTLFFATFIEIQNYNILGWMLYPIFLSYVESGNYLVISLVLFLVSLSSFTAFFIAGILVFISSVYLFDFYLFLSLIPAGIKWIIPIIVSMKGGGLSKMLGTLGGHEKVKYSRVNSKKLSINKIYILGLQVQFLIVAYFYNEINLALLLLFVIVFLFIVNELFARFADQQSFYLAYLSILVFFLFHSSIDIVLILSFIFSIYPVYGLMLNVSPRGKSFISAGVRKPYNIKNDIEKLCQMYEQIPSGEKLLVAYKNPNGQYGNIFNGYRVFNEPLQYAATIKNICLFPDWYMVFENNKEDSNESFWFDKEEDIIDYMKANEISYVLIPDFYGDIKNLVKDDSIELEYSSFNQSKSFNLALYVLK
ncbi:hypothetical protein OZY48_06345 [Aliarcobacter cryaerophilus]|uniref:hypothetical protein n=1 Tax=Aliarcobacter cryaerophilus TaxID=28198 RepID=UPI003BB0E045